MAPVSKCQKRKIRSTVSTCLKDELDSLSRNLKVRWWGCAALRTMHEPWSSIISGNEFKSSFVALGRKMLAPATAGFLPSSHEGWSRFPCTRPEVCRAAEKVEIQHPPGLLCLKASRLERVRFMFQISERKEAKGRQS